MAQQDDDLERDLLAKQLEQGQKKTTTALTGTPDLAPAEGGSLTGAAPDAAPSAPAIDYGRTVGDYGGKLEGFDAGKLGSDHDSAKYQIGRTLSHFDPKGGVTPEALAALNGLGIGTFSGSRDKLNVTGGSHGLQGTTDLDVVRDMDTGGGWQYGVEADDVTRSGGGAGMGADTGGSSLDKIQGLMPTDSDFYKKLQDQLAQQLGGYSNLDRDALLRMMGGGNANAG